MRETQAKAIDPLSAEFFEELKNATERQEMPTNPERATWSMEVIERALAHCERVTDDELWKDSPARYIHEPQSIDIGSAFKTVTITEREYKRLLVIERAHKLSLRLARFSHGSLHALWLSYMHCMETIRDAALSVRNGKQP